MLKIRRNSKQNDFQTKTQPDQAPTTSQRILEKLDPQESLFQISLKTNEQQYSRTFTCWPKQIAKTQSISSSGPSRIEQGCFSKNMQTLRTHTAVMNKKEFHFKKWMYKRERESQLKQSIKMSQKKKSCVSINFNLQNYANKTYNSRIHSKTVALPFEFKKEKDGQGQRIKSQICCNLQEAKDRSNQKDNNKVFHSQRKTKIMQNQLILHKKTGKTLLKSKENQRSDTQNNSSYVKYFSILNALIAEEKKQVLSFPLKPFCPTSKLKGLFQKRRHSESK